jgi:hypothetical protein
MLQLEDVPTSLLNAMLEEEFNSANSNAISAEIAQQAKLLLEILAKTELPVHVINNTTKPLTLAQTVHQVN